MKNFNDFGIKPTTIGYTGEKIKVSKLLNQKITVHSFKIVKSKIEGKDNGKCLYMQVDFNNEKRLVMTGSAGLQDLISQVPEDGFPFTTTIISENERYRFT